MMEQMLGQMGGMNLHAGHGGGGHGGGHGGHGGGGHGGGGRGGGDEQLRAALRASEEQAAAEDAKRLRAGIAASGGVQLGGRGGAPVRHHAGDADLDLQRALEASVKQPQPGRPQPGRPQPGRRY